MFWNKHTHVLCFYFHDELLQLLHGINPQSNENPDARRLITTGKVPTTKDFYDLFCNHGTLWPSYKWVWHSAIPHRQKFFMWLAFRGRLNTKDNMLVKKWATDNGCDTCPATESVHHLALHCRMAQRLWGKLGMSSEASTASTIERFVETIQNKVNDQAWPVCFAACLWWLWKTRNDRVFNRMQRTNSELFRCISGDLRLWASRSTKHRIRIEQWGLKIIV